MEFELISEEEFASLPEEDEQCFVNFEAICRRNMTRMLEGDANEHFTRTVRQQYMASVYAVANECNIQSIPVPSYQNDDTSWDNFNNFALAVQGEVARIRIRGRRSRNSLSVQLTGSARAKIKHHVSQLREVVNNSDLGFDQKKALGKRLDDFLSELENPRLNLGKAMLALTLVLSGLASATTIAADGGNAVYNIMKVIGIDKESEEAAVARLAPPPKALPAPEPEPAAPHKSSSGWDIRQKDLDDIPF